MAQEAWWVKMIGEREVVEDWLKVNGGEIGIDWYVSWIKASERKHTNSLKSVCKTLTAEEETVYKMAA